ncbi:protein diaphanous [Anaeramoeba flamelloides]|uniref:Protein diaphanous n=1 Tax=Anaeramoeba flamelloides TaxID=1746091 RepID=A0ABQ8Z8Z3_9EUKA|nr:protein diaphanous [Anaeramoeba flamelloides]
MYRGKRSKQTPNHIVHDTKTKQEINLTKEEEKQLNKDFEKLISTMNLDSTKQKMMRGMKLAQKKQLLEMKRLEKETTSVDEYLQELSSRPNLDLIRTMRVELTNSSLPWLEDFVKAAGHLHVFDFLRMTLISNEDNDLILECARAVKSIMNNAPGLKGVLALQHSIEILTLGLTCSCEKSLKIFFDLLAAVSTFGQYNEKVNEEILSIHKKQKLLPYYLITKYLFKTKDYELRFSAMMLILALLNNEKISNRVEIRFLLIDLEFDKWLKTVKRIEGDPFTNLLELFETQMENDFDHMEYKYGVSNYNIYATGSIMKGLTEEIKDQEYHDLPLEILRLIVFFLTSGNFKWRDILTSIDDILIDSVEDLDNKKGTFKEILFKQTEIYHSETLNFEIEQFQKNIENFEKINERNNQEFLNLLHQMKIFSERQIKKIKKHSKIQTIIESLKLKFNEKFDELKIENKNLKKQKKHLINQNNSFNENISYYNKILNKNQNNANVDDKSIKQSNNKETNNDIENKTSSQSVDKGVIPPPPMLGGGGGIPPPPPSMLGGGGGMFPPPLMFGNSFNKKKIPKSNLVGLNWNKIPSRLGSQGYWKDLDTSEEMDIKLEDFKKLFSKKKKFELNNSKNKTNQNNKKMAGLINAKKTSNIEITLRKIKKNAKEICQAILKIDEDILTEDFVRSLLTQLPTDDERRVIQKYKGKISKLTFAEKFYQQLIPIPHIRERLVFFLFYKNFNENIQTVSQQLKHLDAACNEMKNNENFNFLLQIILKIGNVMNGGSYRGGASGFNLEILPKLKDTKSPNDRTLSLMNYISTLITEKYPKVLNILNNILIFDKASEVDLSHINQNMNSINTKLLNLEEELNFFKENESSLQKEDNFYPIMNNFYINANVSFRNVKLKFEKANKKFKETHEYFGITNQKNYSPMVFFSLITDCLKDLRMAGKQNIKKIENQKKLEILRKKKERHQKLKHFENVGSSMINEVGVMDDLIEKMRSGEAFKLKKSQSLPNFQSNGINTNKNTQRNIRTRRVIKNTRQIKRINKIRKN